MWPRTPGADLYNLVLWKDGKRVADLWPETNHYSVPPNLAVAGRRLAPGRYVWFAFAVFLDGNTVSFGKRVAHGELTLVGG